jgi:type III restriction enzyme
VPNAVIENPILDSPFDESRRHFRFGEDRITDKVEDSQRLSTCFIPIASSKRSATKQVFEARPSGPGTPG